nr:flagellar hook capping FlgD N-terminal domain-containing protein [Moorella sulfitireducens]
MTTGVTATGGLSKNDFLKLLAAQLSNQDPLNPMSDTEFIAQMAQFTALEQMYNLNESFNLLRQDLQQSMMLQVESMMLQAVSMMGKEVTAVVDDRTLTGTVSKITWTGDGIMLLVGGLRVPLEAVVEVALPGDAAGSATAGEAAGPGSFGA